MKLILPTILTILSSINFAYARTSHQCSLEAGQLSPATIKNKNYFGFGCELYAFKSASISIEVKELKDEAKQSLLTLKKFYYWNQWADVIFSVSHVKDDVNRKTKARTDLFSVGYKIDYENWMTQVDLEVRRIREIKTEPGIKFKLDYKINKKVFVYTKANASDSNFGIGFGLSIQF
jgi:hypothetical protein